MRMEKKGEWRGFIEFMGRWAVRGEDGKMKMGVGAAGHVCDSVHGRELTAQNFLVSQGRILAA